MRRATSSADRSAMMVATAASTLADAARLYIGGDLIGFRGKIEVAERELNHALDLLSDSQHKEPR